MFMNMSKTCQYETCERGCYGEFCLMHKKRKAIPKKGKQTILYEEWRDEQARPYLIKKYGEVCAECKGARCGNKQLDIDHIKSRGSNYNLKFSLTNVQFLGSHPCHFEKTNNVNTKEK